MAGLNNATSSVDGQNFVQENRTSGKDSISFGGIMTAIAEAGGGIYDGVAGKVSEIVSSSRQEKIALAKDVGGTALKAGAIVGGGIIVAGCDKKVDASQVEDTSSNVRAVSTVEEGAYAKDFQEKTGLSVGQDKDGNPVVALSSKAENPEEPQVEENYQASSAPITDGQIESRDFYDELIRRGYDINAGDIKSSKTILQNEVFKNGEQVEISTLKLGKFNKGNLVEKFVGYLKVRVGEKDPNLQKRWTDKLNGVLNLENPEIVDKIIHSLNKYFDTLENQEGTINYAEFESVIISIASVIITDAQGGLDMYVIDNIVKIATALGIELPEIEEATLNNGLNLKFSNISQKVEDELLLELGLSINETVERCNAKLDTILAESKAEIEADGGAGMEEFEVLKTALNDLTPTEKAELTIVHTRSGAENFALTDLASVAKFYSDAEIYLAGGKWRGRDAEGKIIAGIEGYHIPDSEEEIEKWNEFKEWMTDLGYGAEFEVGGYFYEIGSTWIQLSEYSVAESAKARTESARARASSAEYRRKTAEQETKNDLVRGLLGKNKT